MPPTSFAPSHATPFKSTLSSSQQPHAQHTPFPDDPARALSISDIDPRHWKYHAEGGKNLLLSYSPPAGVKSPFATSAATYALRIPKAHPPGSDVEAAHDDDQEAERFTRHVVTPLLGDSSVLPHCIRIPVVTDRDRGIIDTLAASIELHRPSARRAHPARIRTEALTCIYAVHDITAPAAHDDVLCVEIKPKWGFLPSIDALPPSSPNVEIKKAYSRFRMHAVARNPALTPQQLDEIYDPLDLYSSDKRRVQKALHALWNEWIRSEGSTNNLRLFCNGDAVHPHDAHAVKRVAKLLDASHRVQDGADKVRDAVWDKLTGRLEEELLRPLLPHDRGVSVLHRLAQLQARLDPLDVEGLAQLWLQHTQSHLLGQLPDSNEPDVKPVSATELLPMLEPLLSTEAPHPTRVDEAVQAFLVSACFKDCSLLVRLSSHSASTFVVDLDAKSPAKLATMQQTDAQVCAAFLAWLAVQPHPPTRSLP